MLHVILKVRLWMDSQLSQCFGIFCENKNPAYEHSFYI